MSKISYEEIDNICEKHKNQLYDLALSIKCSNYDTLLHVIGSHTFNDLRLELVEYLESQKIEVE